MVKKLTKHNEETTRALMGRLLSNKYASKCEKKKTSIILFTFFMLCLFEMLLILTWVQELHATPVQRVILVKKGTTGWWLAGQISITGSGYQHAQQLAISVCTWAIHSALLLNVKSAAVYTLMNLLHKVCPSVCSKRNNQKTTQPSI